MSLGVGDRIAHYDVTALIGEGGMGQVYQATDTKLNRQVALKILPEAFATDPDRLARFQREAQVLASLNHPGIAAIYGIEEQDDTRALVLELVEGPTLAERISKGPIPIDEALPIAKQIAEALEAAHEAGVIHRDLKPANIKVREDGTVKVLDFGLAKALDTEPAGDPSQSPTLTAAATQMGVIMGTAAYMSPEQARGRPVDRRADIWSFGAVLFEMLTGQRVFKGRDVSETLAGVIRSEPSWQRLPGDVPPRLDNLLRRCLQKEPRERVRDMGDVRLSMEGAFEVRIGAPSEAAMNQRHVWLRPIPLVVIGILASAVTALSMWNMTRSDPPRVVRFAVAPPGSEGVAIGSSGSDIAITPDGTRILFSTPDGNPFQWHVQSLDELVSTPLEGVDTTAFSPFVSPNGEWLGFLDLSGPTLKKVSLRGGDPILICNLGPGRFLGASWGPDDMIVFGTDTSRVRSGGRCNMRQRWRSHGATTWPASDAG